MRKACLFNTFFLHIGITQYEHIIGSLTNCSFLGCNVYQLNHPWLRQTCSDSSLSRSGCVVDTLGQLKIKSALSLFFCLHEYKMAQ